MYLGVPRVRSRVWIPPGDWICNWCKWRHPLYFEMKYKYDLKTLPEAQQIQGIESVTQVRDGCKRKSRQAGTLLSLFHCQKNAAFFSGLLCKPTPVRFNRFSPGTF